MSDKPGKAKSRSAAALRAFHEEEAVARGQDLRYLRRLIPLLKPYQGGLWLSVVLLLMLSGLGLLRPLIMGDLVEQAGVGDGAAVLRGGALLAALLVFTQTLSFIQSYLLQWVGTHAMADLREKVFAHLQRLSLRFFDRTPVGRLTTRATSDVDAVSEMFAFGVPNAVGDLLLLTGIVVMMVRLNWRLSLIAFASLPLAGMVVVFVRSRSRQAYQDIRQKTARLNAFLSEQVSGIAVVQAYGRERAMAHEFDEINLAYRDANRRSIFYEALLDAAIEMVSTLCIAGVLLWAGLRPATSTAASFGLLVTFTQYIKQFFEPISMLSQRYTVLQSALSGAERIFQLLDTGVTSPKDLEEGERPAGPAEIDAAAAPDEVLALSGVTFGYKPGQAVLHQVSLRVRRGEKIALVGATGAGKSTVAALLLKLYEVEEGQVRVQGRDVRGLSRTELLRGFAVVPQDVFLFAGTVLSNITLSTVSGPDRPAERARAEEALRRLGVAELFLAREGGLDARVDERGANFSAGERQLLAFARALYRDAPVLILDEATASVDSDTEARLQTALEVVMKDRTALIIAHRLSTIRAVDRIAVFHKGRLGEEGTHEELLQRGGIYARLYELHFAHERATSAAPPASPPPAPAAP